MVTFLFSIACHCAGLKGSKASFGRFVAVILRLFCASILACWRVFSRGLNWGLMFFCLMGVMFLPMSSAKLFVFMVFGFCFDGVILAMCAFYGIFYCFVLAVCFVQIAI